MKFVLLLMTLALVVSEAKRRHLQRLPIAGEEDHAVGGGDKRRKASGRGEKEN